MSMWSTRLCFADDLDGADAAPIAYRDGLGDNDPNPEYRRGYFDLAGSLDLPYMRVSVAETSDDEPQVVVLDVRQMHLLVAAGTRFLAAYDPLNEEKP